MGLTGKYDFPGMKKAGAVGLKAVLASFTWGAWLIKSPFSAMLDWVDELLVNYLANKGLIVLNLGADWANGEIDENNFTKAFADGLKQVLLGRDKLTPEQGKAIDDAVIKAADKFIPFNP